MARLDIGAEKEPVRTNRVSADLWRSSCGRLRMRTRKRSRQCSGQIEDGAGRVWPIVNVGWGRPLRSARKTSNQTTVILSAAPGFCYGLMLLEKRRCLDRKYGVFR